jgi:hypothetical protein
MMSGRGIAVGVAVSSGVGVARLVAVALNVTLGVGVMAIVALEVTVGDGDESHDANQYSKHPNTNHHSL